MHTVNNKQEIIPLQNFTRTVKTAKKCEDKKILRIYAIGC